MRIADAAFVLGVSRQTLADQAKRGRIKARRIRTALTAAGFYWDIPRAEVDRLRQRREA